jgi:X-Pro dipeptidyl-peptidase
MIVAPSQLPQVSVHLAETSVQLPLVGSVPQAATAGEPELRAEKIQPDFTPSGHLEG